MWSRALVKSLSLPLFIVFGQSMSMLWSASPAHVIVASILFIPFSVAALWIVDQYDHSTTYGKKH